MNHFILIPAALVAFQAQAVAPVKLPITQESRNTFIVFTGGLPVKGDKVMAFLRRDIKAQHGKGRWTDDIDFPKGSKLMGTCPKDHAMTFDRLILPNGDPVALAPFTVVFKPGDITPQPKPGEPAY